MVRSLVVVPIDPLDLIFPNHMLPGGVYYSVPWILDNRQTANYRNTSHFRTTLRMIELAIIVLVVVVLFVVVALLVVAVARGEGCG